MENLKPIAIINITTDVRLSCEDQLDINKRLKEELSDQYKSIIFWHNPETKIDIDIKFAYIRE